MNPLMGLHVGLKVEVYYTVNKDGGESKIWWPGTIRSLSYIEDQRGSTLRGSITFDTLHGFRSSSEQVVFDTPEELRDRKNTLYAWRVEGSGDSVGGEPSDSDQNSMEVEDVDVQDKDPDFSPIGKQGKVRKRSHGDIQAESFPTRGQETQEVRDMEHLRGELSSLDAEVQSHAQIMKVLKNEVFIRPRGTPVAQVIPLEFMAHRLQSTMDKVLTVPSRISSTDLRHGFSIYSQECFKRTSDCTLLQFDCIARHVNKSIASGVRFTPSFED